MELDIFIFEVIGTIAFAISGATAAIESDMDLMGIVTLGATTAVGGGVIRDIILNVAPPNAFREPIFVSIALISIAIFLIIIKLWERSKLRRMFTPISANHDQRVRRHRPGHLHRDRRQRGHQQGAWRQPASGSVCRYADRCGWRRDARYLHTEETIHFHEAHLRFCFVNRSRAVSGVAAIC